VWSKFSTAALTELGRSNTKATRVDVLQGGRAAYTLEVVSGQVTVDVDRAVRRNLSCSLVDPTGSLTEGDVDDLLNPYDCEIAPYRGVMAAGVAELAPQGVFQLTARDVVDTDDGLVISLDGQDRAMGYQGGMGSALSISAGTPVETAIQLLLASRNPLLNLLSLNTGYTCGPLLYAPDIDVWREASDLAASVGAQLFHDRTGLCVLAHTGPAPTTSVARFAEGDGLLMSVDRKEDSDTIQNVVVAQSTNGAIVYEAADTNPASPTFSGGRYGRHVAKPVISQHIQSLQQAKQVATTRLAYELGRSETVTFTAVPNPALDVNEVVTVDRPRVGLTDRGLVVATISMPLASDGVMQVGCRSTTLSADGQVLPVDSLA
jgi:hypothetical protein